MDFVGGFVGGRGDRRPTIARAGIARPIGQSREMCSAAPILAGWRPFARKQTADASQ
jgi:hypothetical protein